MTARRPGGVTLLVVLIVIQGLVGVVGGIVLILLRHNKSVLDQVDKQQSSSVRTTSTTVVVIAVIAIIIGLIYLAVASGLAHGNGFARFLVGLVSVVNLAGGIYLALAKTGQLRVQGITTAVIAVIVLALLYSHRASDFFRTH